MRKRSTEAEHVLWTMLRGRALDGFKFRRQHQIDWFLVDFFCIELKLAIELDGEPHFEEEARKDDAIRSAILKRFGVRVIRFENCEVMANPRLVLERIRSSLKPS
ncbi:MAG TPA: endonuclease domain-containing protein [Thermoanaerobaculia bacterium]|nr:endonuclease domain-containing protein [Thermoanaerobaculia bacterium]